MGVMRGKKTEIARLLAKLKVDAVEEAVRLAMDVDCPYQTRARIWCELIQYTQPKLKAVEISNKDGKPFQLSFDLDALVL